MPTSKETVSPSLMEMSLNSFVNTGGSVNQWNHLVSQSASKTVSLSVSQSVGTAGWPVGYGVSWLPTGRSVRQAGSHTHNFRSVMLTGVAKL